MFVAVLVLFGVLLFSHLAFTRLRGYSLGNHINPDNLSQPSSLWCKSGYVGKNLCGIHKLRS